jgi:glycosyltransferase involved in cell wall biosynthesis
MRAVRSVWHAVRRFTKGMVVSDYREYCAGRPYRRALVSYIVHPLLLPARFRQRVIFSPFGIAQEIPRALNEMGYSVDIINYDNTHWRPHRKYDLFIGHGAANFEQLAATLGPDTKKTYFASGLHCKIWKLLQAERAREFMERTGHVLRQDSTITFDEELAYRLATGIIYLGNLNAGASYAGLPNIHGINNSFYPVTWDGWKTKDYGAGRMEFLFFQGHGNIHKGLDRVIEAFAATPHLHLHVCQDVQPAFRRAYEGILSRADNIHLYGFIRQRSDKFYELARRCNWILSATCAEGQPGSVIEMMAHGLIPIVPEAANINLDWWGVPLANCAPQRIAGTCLMASEIAAAECHAMSNAVIAETRQRYSIEHFRRSFQKAVQTIMSTEPQQFLMKAGGAAK